MYARVSTVTVPPGRVDERTRLYREKVLPQVQKLKGFKGVFMLGDRETNKMISVALWESEADMLATKASGFLKNAVNTAVQAGFSPPTTEHYEVTLQTQNIERSEKMYARVTTVTLQPGKVDDLTKRYQNNTLPQVKQMKGFKGAYVLADREANKAIVMVLWETEADMKATEASGFYNRAATSVRETGISSQTSMEHFEVTLQAEPAMAK